MQLLELLNRELEEQNLAIARNYEYVKKKLRLKGVGDWRLRLVIEDEFVRAVCTRALPDSVLRSILLSL